METIFIIARKELLSAFRQRNLVLLLIVTPIVLVTLIGLAFGGLAGSGPPAFEPIRVAVVNEDRGVTPAGLSMALGPETVDLGAWLVRTYGRDSDSGQSVDLNFGDILAGALLDETRSTGPGATAGGGESEVFCPLGEQGESSERMFGGSVGALLHAERLEDAAAARAGVEQGDYAAAVIIPASFSAELFSGLEPGAQRGAQGGAQIPAGAVEVIANNATSISAGIVSAIVEGIVNQFVRVEVTLRALHAVASDGSAVSGLALTGAAVDGADVLQLLEPLDCLLVPNVGSIQLARRPLDASQTRSAFASLMAMMGGMQAVFFALFTGIFGINSIYEDRRQGTLQRVLASPTSSSQVLWGRLAGNFLIVVTQLLVLFSAFTVIASVIEREPVLVWGTNFGGLLVLILVLSLFTTGLGVLVVGVASTSEVVQLVGPLLVLGMAGLGGMFGNVMPGMIGRISPTWWAIDALGKLGANETNIGLNLLVLFVMGLIFVGVGTYFFRRRMGL